MKNPKDPEYEQFYEWLGRRYLPEKFNPKKVYFVDPKEALEQRLFYTDH